jgi:hypothetical protein
MVSAFHPKCINTAYDVLSVSRKFVVKKKKQEFVVLEMETNHCLSIKKRLKIHFTMPQLK